MRSALSEPHVPHDDGHRREQHDQDRGGDAERLHVLRLSPSDAEATTCDPQPDQR